MTSKDILQKIIDAAIEPLDLGQVLDCLEDGQLLTELGITGADTDAVEDAAGIIIKKISIYSENEMMRMEWIA